MMHKARARGPWYDARMSIQRNGESSVVATLAEDPVLTDDVNAIMSITPPCDVRLDFAGVDFVNSSNLSLLLRLRQHLISHDRTLKLCNIRPIVWKAFTVTGLDHVFDIRGNP